jgi:hypothetical protein
VRSCSHALVKTADIIEPDRWTSTLYQERYEIWRSLYPVLAPKFVRMR